LKDKNIFNIATRAGNKEVKLELNLNKYPTKFPKILIIEGRTKKIILLEIEIQN
jgi:hypothetical protein